MDDRVHTRNRAERKLARMDDCFALFRNIIWDARSYAYVCRRDLNSVRTDSRKRRCGAGRMWISCAFFICIAACGRPDPETELDAAAASFSASKYDDAILRLNYVVQLEPENIRARELRGDVALRLGDYQSAINEFNYVRELGVPRESVALRLIEGRRTRAEHPTLLHS